MNLKKTLTTTLTALALLFNPISSSISSTISKTESKTGSLMNLVRQAYDNKYDNHSFFTTNEYLENIYKSCYEIHTSHQYEVDYYDLTKKLKKDKKGRIKRPIKETKTQYIMSAGSSSGLKIVDNELYLITNHHVVSPEFEEMDVYNFVIPVGHAKLKKTKVLLFTNPKLDPETKEHISDEGLELELVASDKDLDIAVLKTKKQDYDKIKDYITYGNFGDSSDLSPGNWLYAIGYPNMLSNQLVQGIYKGNDNPHYPNDDTIYHMSCTVIPGNSGGPVYALRDGVPELVGIARQTHGAQDGGAIKINLVKDFLKKNKLERLLE